MRSLPMHQGRPTRADKIRGQAAARAILPVSGALFTGRIARATFRVGLPAFYA